MREKAEVVRNEMKTLIAYEDDRACIESMDRIAQDIAIIALENFTGDLLRKALAIAVALTEFANELEDA